MPNEISVNSVSSVSPAGESHSELKSEPFVPATATQPRSQAQPYVNPSLRLDPALGLVVIEFHDDSGTLTSSIPSERQIEAYRRHQDTRPEQAKRAGAKPEAPATTIHAGSSDQPPPALTPAPAHASDRPAPAPVQDSSIRDT